MKKILLTVYVTEDKVIRMAINKIAIYFFGMFIVAPYFFIGFYASHSEQDVKVGNQIPTPIKKSIAIDSISKIQSSIVKPQSVANENPFRLSEVKTVFNQESFKVDFILSKVKLDSTIKSGTIAIDLVDENNNVIASSEKNIYKFKTARVSRFELNGIRSIPTKMRIKLNDATSKTDLVLEEIINLRR